MFRKIRGVVLSFHNYFKNILNKIYNTYFKGLITVNKFLDKY